MSINFNADEIFAMAIRIEQNGAQFYLRAAECAVAPAAWEFFKGLAAFEQTHERTFAAMREELGENFRLPTAFDPEGQSAAYLKALADGRVFDIHTDPAKRLTGRESLKDIITMAIGLEKDSIIFYLGMRELVPAGQGRDKIDDIIKEEMRHIAFLSEKLATL